MGHLGLLAVGFTRFEEESVVVGLSTQTSYSGLRDEFTRLRCVVKLQLCKIFVTHAPETRTQSGIRQGSDASAICKTAYAKIEESDTGAQRKKVLADTGRLPSPAGAKLEQYPFRTVSQVTHNVLSAVVHVLRNQRALIHPSPL